jgi:nickel superoxide dismutase
MQKTITLSILLAMVFFTAATAYSHCEIPCGIYDDEMRIQMVREHITTIEKSMTMIISLKKEKAHDANQMVRWVMNKEKHADEIQHIVTQYFMTQRIKPETKSYHEKLELLHKILIYSMKCKQTTDLNNIKELNAAVDKFNSLYFKK